MRKIDKEAPLSDFLQHIAKNNPSNWNDIPGDLRYNMRMHMLVYEQECLCGYSEIPLEAESTSSHIDHFIMRIHDPSKTFDWNNMIVSTIDEDFGGKYKDNTYKIQPHEYSQIFNPIVDDMAQYIEYSGDGQIVPKQNISPINAEKVKKTIEVFGLDNYSLKERRRTLLQQLNSYKDIPKEQIVRCLQASGFISVINWFIDTH